MARRRRRRPAARRWLRRVGATALAVPSLYLLAALIGSLLSVNRSWNEPAQGTTIYLATNGIHTDVVMPVSAVGLDWTPYFPRREFAAVEPNARLIAFGLGEQRVYLETPTWWDITPATIWAALTGGTRVMHVEYVRGPADTMRQVRLRPEEYRRLWAAIRADLAVDRRGQPLRIDHLGYGPSDLFYSARGKQNALRTCNTAVANWLRLAGVETSLWSPFAQGLLWRYRAVGPR